MASFDRPVASAISAIGRSGSPGKPRPGYLEQVADPAALDAAITAALDPLLRLDPAAYAATKQRLRQPAMDRAAADLTP